MSAFTNGKTPDDSSGTLRFDQGFSTHQTSVEGLMRDATRTDAIYILLDINKEIVWRIIKGMNYSTYAELALAVQSASAL
jgi:hypothetical protein